MIELATLTDEQQAAVDKAIEAIGKGDGAIYKIGGYAGTGKTTVARHIAEKLPGCLPCAFTGKAAYRLRQKGMGGAITIHRTIYEYATKDAKKRLQWELKDDVEGDWFLIDEGSMISGKLWGDLMSFGRPVLLLGDPGQLEPVGQDPRLMHKADVVLEQIHRQAEGNGIIQFATDIRKGWYDKCDVYPDVAIHHDKPTVADLKWADIMICAFNRTRIRVNRKYREVYGYTGLLNPGEKVIVLRNNNRKGVFNGQILTIKNIVNAGPIKTTAICVTDDDQNIELSLFNQQFNTKPISNWNRDDIVLADYGYCITCHKSQGSEWDRVVVIDEQCSRLWEAKRWRYTAITRASQELRYFTNGK